MKVFTNRKMKQFIIILVTVIMLFNVIAPAPIALQVYAAEAGNDTGGVLSSLLCNLVSWLALGFQKVLNGVAWVATSLGTGEAAEVGDVFIADIVYNQLPITDANIFDASNENPLFKSGDAGMSGVVKQWYQITRMMAIAASLVVLVYVAIKILLSSTGQSKAKYTESLKDWLLCLLLIFSLHYVMAAILFCSDWIVQFFGNASDAFSYEAFQEQAFAGTPTSLIYGLAWLVLLGYTFVFLILYIKRLILICFFVVISPLIVILSTINKLRGKGGGVLDYWLKQFIANVIMQPMDALLFAIIASSITILATAGQPLLALALVMAFFPVRAWVTQFFDIKADQNTQEGARGALGKGVALGMKAYGAVGEKASNLPKIPKLHKSNGDGGSVEFGSGTSNVGAETGGTGRQVNIAKKDNKTTGYEPNKGFQGGIHEMSPEMLAMANNAMTGDTKEASSYTASSVKTVPSNEGVVGGNSSGNPRVSSSSNQPKGTTINGGVIRRALTAGATKGLGMATGVAAMSLNYAAGKGLTGYGEASRATQGIINGTGRFISDNGGVFNTVDSLANYAADRIDNSYIMTGEHGRYQKQLENDNFWYGDDFQNYAKDNFVNNATEEEWATFEASSDKQEFLVNYERNSMRASDRWDRQVAIVGGNEQRAERAIAQRRMENWKKGGSKRPSNTNRREAEVEASERKVEMKPREEVRTETVVVDEKFDDMNLTDIMQNSGNYVDMISESELMRDFYNDREVNNLAQDLIEASIEANGEGHPLFEQYNNASSQGAKKEIAKKFLIETALGNMGEKGFKDIIKGKDYRALKKLFDTK